MDYKQIEGRTLHPKWSARWIGEFVVIVLGVLVALAVDDWRDYRADRALERHLLVRLAADLKADEADLEFSRALVARRLWVLREVVSKVAGSEDRQLVPPDSLLNPGRARSLLEAQGRSGLLLERWEPIQQPLGSFTAFPEFDLSDDSYREMLASGALQTIEDADLRSAILAYYRTAEDIGGNERRVGQYQARLETALSSIGVTVIDGLTLSEFASRIPTGSTVHAELRRSLRDVVFQLAFLNLLVAARSELEGALESSLSLPR